MSGSGQRIKSWNPSTNTLKDVEQFSLLHGETALAALTRFSISTPNLYKIQQSKMGSGPPELQALNGFATKFRSRIDKALAVCENLFLSNVREIASGSQQNNVVPPVESSKTPSQHLNGGNSSHIHPKKRFAKGEKLVTSISCNAIHADTKNQELDQGLGRESENTLEIPHKICNHNNSSITSNPGLLTHIVGPISNSIKEKKHSNRCKIIPSLKSFNFSQASGDRSATEFNCVAATRDSQNLAKEHNSNPHPQQTFLRGASKKCKKTSNKIFRVGSYRKKTVLAGNTSPSQPRVMQDAMEVNHNMNSNGKGGCMLSLPEQVEEINANSLSTEVQEGFHGDSNSDLHRFFPMCCSLESVSCTSCSRSMVNKPALQCQNCLITVHEEPGCSAESNVGPCYRVRPQNFSLDEINEQIKLALSQRMALRLSPCSEKGPHMPPPAPPDREITICSPPVAVHTPAIEYEFRRVLSDTSLLADAKCHTENSANLATTTTSYSCPANVNTMHTPFPLSSPSITASQYTEPTARSSSPVDKTWNPFEILDKSIAYIDKSMIDCVDGANNLSGPSSLNSSAAGTALDSQYNGENENIENNLAPICADKIEDRDESAATASNLNSKMCDVIDGVIATPVSSLAPVSLSHDSESLLSSSIQAREDVQPPRDSPIVDLSSAGSKHQGGIADFPGVARDVFLNFDGQNPANNDDWTTVRNEKKVTKELTSKEIKKQDIIHELILTEKLHVQTLSIIMKIYSYALSNTLGVDQTMVNLIFPRISNLYALHAAFYQNLKERQLKAPIVAAIGDILVEQFTGTNGDTMKREYGIFCSKHKTAIATYKNLVKSDKNVQGFMRDALLHPLCRRKSIPECILAVTQRITKYPIFIESIIKANKSKKIFSPDDELVTKALDGLKSVLTHVDEQINLKELEQRLSFICARIEAKSYAIYEGQRFGKGDLLVSASASRESENFEETSQGTKARRRLLFEGTNPLELTYAGLSGVAKNRQSCEVHALILTDLIVFLQESGGKYAFANADNMSAVLGLKKLLVREKAGDSTAFYIINCQPSAPEMYEVACENAKVKGQWLLALRKAISQASIKHINENEITKQASQIDEDIKKMNEKYAQVQKLLGEAEKKDADIKAMLMQKNGILSTLLDCLHKGTPRSQTNENFASTPQLTSEQQITLSQSTSFIEIASQKSMGSSPETESSKRQSLEVSVLENLTWHLPVPRSSKHDLQPSGLLQLKEFLETLLVELYKSSLQNAPVHAISLNRSVSNVLDHRRDGSAWYLANPLALAPGTTQSFWPHSSLSENQVGAGQFKRAETFSGFDTQLTPPNDCPPHLLQPSQPILTAPGARNYLLKSLKISKKSTNLPNNSEPGAPMNSGGPTIALDSSSYSTSTTSCSSIPLSDSSKTSQISLPISSAHASQFNLPFNRAFKDQTDPHAAFYHTNTDDDTTFRVKTIQSFNYILGIVNQELTGQARLLAENADLHGRVNRYESEKTDRKSQMWHNQQLEELRNLQETVSKEKEALKRECEAEKAAIQAEKRYVQAQTEQLMALRERLKADQELILTQKNTIQRYWAEVMDDRGRHSTHLPSQKTAANINPHPNEGGFGISCNSNAQHGRSKSYESSSYEAAILKASSAPHGSSNSSKGMTKLNQLGQEALDNCANFPPHLISALNERKLELLPTPLVPVCKKNAHKSGPGNSKLLPLHLSSTTSLAGLPEANGPLVVGNGGNSNCKKGSQNGGGHNHSTSFLGSSSSFSFKKFQDWREAAASNNQSTLSNCGAQTQGRHSFFSAPPTGSKTQNPKSRHPTPDKALAITDATAAPCNGGLNYQMLPLKLASNGLGPRRFLSHMDHASVLEVQNEESNSNDIDPLPNQRDPVSGRQPNSDTISIKMSSSSSPPLNRDEGGLNHNASQISFKPQSGPSCDYHITSPSSNTAIGVSNPPHTNPTPPTNNGQSSLYSPKLIQSIYYF